MKNTQSNRDVAQAILDYHELFDYQNHDQGQWVGEDAGVHTETVAGIQVNVCNTSMCAAGTAVFVTSSIQEWKDFNSGSIDGFHNEGKRLLGLEGDEAGALFYDTNDEQARTILRGIADGDESIFDKWEDGEFDDLDL